MRPANESHFPNKQQNLLIKFSTISKELNNIFCSTNRYKGKVRISFKLLTKNKES